jgi:hypothetical protein
VRLRRVRPKATGESHSVRPSFLLPYGVGTTDDAHGPCPCVPSASPSGPRPASSARIPCTGTVWRSVRAATASSARPRAGPTRPSTCRPTSATRPAPGPRPTSPPPSEGAVDWVPPWPRPPTRTTRPPPTGPSGRRPGHRGRLPTKDGRRRRPGLDPSGVARVVPAGGTTALLPARLARPPQPGRVERGVPRTVGGGVGGVPRPEPAVLRAAVATGVGVEAVRADDGRQSPAERLDAHRHHDGWLQNLQVSASLGGFRR